ncbi:hypothetical protein ElyMa_006952700 [Elysia marginata]|uniref:Uncharacterized protein n=1 Tax=Elysia marginata TaxID=1093978 RepID=A0AAV4JLS3_9GAST|nr:hypothetical protein ElyMa_006952700 [Elysia marginata]
MARSHSTLAQYMVARGQCAVSHSVQVKVRLPGPESQQRKEENRRRNCVVRPDISPLRHYGKHMIIVLTAATTISSEKVKTADILTQDPRQATILALSIPPASRAEPIYWLQSSPYF